MAGLKRPHMPLAVKLRAALRLAGLDPDAKIQWDHDPALAMRERTDKGWIPAANDDLYIVPRTKASHAEKTFGTHVPLSGDISKIAKMKRIAEKRRPMVEVSETIEPDGALRIKTKRAWPKRPFPKKPKKGKRKK